MKSERRHELQHNALADWISGAFEAIQPYQNAILGIVLLSAVGIIGWTVWSSRAAALESESWDEMRPPLFIPKSPDELNHVVAVYPNTPAAHWATVLAGDLFLQQGAIGIMEDKKRGGEILNEAEKYYRSIYTDGPKSGMLAQRAAFGLARTLETQGRVDDALKVYREITTSYPDGMFRATSADRIQDLQRDDTKRFYDDFKNFNPKQLAAIKEPKSPASPSPRQLRESLALPLDNPPSEPSKTPAPAAGDKDGKHEPEKNDPKADASKPAAPKSEPESMKANTPKPTTPDASKSDTPAAPVKADNTKSDAPAVPTKP